MIGNAMAAPIKPKKKRSETMCWNWSSRLMYRPSTVPSAQRRAASVAWPIGTRPLAVGSRGCGWLISQNPSRAGTRNQAKRGRARSPRMIAAARTTRWWGRQRDKVVLFFWDIYWGHEVAVEERLGEEDRRKRGGARADDH